MQRALSELARRSGASFPAYVEIIRLLNWWEATHQLRFSASHVAGVDNGRADDGSRISANPKQVERLGFASGISVWLADCPLAKYNTFPSSCSTVSVSATGQAVPFVAKLS
ncbi:hypothetical protein PHPALM_28773 [Phytophthora palmivora]|uniref:Uncharacterized protein n=1 Tax=Phytophthora palmivora TaxID=4796 RepID=A0A2P4X981_9STRA|nr:hypothetical protein PHPALM_28773 [Phytophthora palmivora]